MSRLGSLAVVAVAFFSWTQAAVARTWIVDAPNPEIECKNADFPSIEAAVQAAAPGDTVRVCPGDYVEAVTVDKPLTILGSTRQPNNITGDPTKDTTLNLQRTIPVGFTLDAPLVVVRGFIVQFGNVGIRTNSAFSGYDVARNLFRENAFAVEVGSDGSIETDVDQNVFTNNSFGVIGNVGSGAMRNVEIALNSFTADETTMLLSNRPTDVRVENNDVTRELSGITASFGERGSIAHNMLMNIPRPIRVVRMVGQMIAYNEISSGHGDGIIVQASVETDTEFNHVTTQGQDGIRLIGTQRSTVRNNHVDANRGDGIALESGSSGNTVGENVSELNGRFGMFMGSQSSANNIEQNLMDDNGGFDCADGTAGPGTSGTANFWIHDLGDTSSRPGLCKPTGLGAAGSANGATASTAEETCIPLAFAVDTPTDSPAWLDAIPDADAAPGLCDPNEDDSGS